MVYIKEKFDSWPDSDTARLPAATRKPTLLGGTPRLCLLERGRDPWGIPGAVPTLVVGML